MNNFWLFKFMLFCTKLFRSCLTHSFSLFTMFWMGIYLGTFNTYKCYLPGGVAGVVVSHFDASTKRMSIYILIYYMTID